MTREEQIYKKAEGDCIAMLESIERGDIIKGSICPQSYRAGFMDGAKWADSHPQWIPVEEELPKEGGEYFVSDGTDSMVDIWLHGIGWSKPDNNERVTHWMPKPLPPKKEE